MQPNFALKLSFDGIRLLHRISDGWHNVGQVALDDDDFSGALALLRKKAVALDNAPLRTKLVIPPEQIKFLTIDTAQSTDEEVNELVAASTPYALDDLVVDCDRSGGRTHIAAVARETLAEAEAFAVENNFEPIAFVAEPEPFTFRTEIFFGETEHASGLLSESETYDKDVDALKIIGATQAIDLSADTPMSADTTPPDAEEADESAESSPAAQEDTHVDDQIDEALTESVEAENDNINDTPEPDLSETTNEQVDDASVAIDEPAEAQSSDTEDRPTEPEEDIDPIPVVTFGSRRDVTMTPPGAAPTVGPAVAAPPPAPTPTLEAEKRTDTDVEIEPETPKNPKTKKKKQKKSAARKEAENLTVYGARKPAQVGGKPKYLGLILTGLLVLFLFLVALWANTLSEEGIAGWFGTTTEPDGPVTEIAVALVETATELPATEEAAPIEPATVDPVPILREETTVAVAPQEEAAPLATPEAPSGTLPILRQSVGRVLSPAEADRIYAATGVYQRAPRLPLTPTGGSLDGFNAATAIAGDDRLAQIYAPDVELMLPDATITPPVNPPPAGVTYARDLRGFILATPEGTVTPEGAVVFAGPPERIPPFRPGTDVPDVVIERPLTGGNAPLVLVAGPPPRVPPLRPEGLAPLPEVAAAVSSPDTSLLIDRDDLVVLTGAPDRTPPLRPESFADLLTETTPAETLETPSEDIAPETLAEIDVNEDPAPVDDIQVAEPVAPEATTDVEIVDETVETALLEEAEIVVVNPTNALSAYGVNLSTYRPNLRPRSATPDPISNLIASADPALAGFRPNNRPSTLSGPPIDLVALADPALSGFRPTLRPSTATPQPPEDEDITSLIAAIADAAPATPFVAPTAQAIRVSARPDTRPQNFAQVVARAQRAAPQAAVVTSTPAAPTGPTPGGVARAATIDNAIGLREVNLIGVFGQSGNRRALVRLANGNMVRVEVGDSLDGGRVTAIGEGALNYVKRGRTVTLQLPTG